MKAIVELQHISYSYQDIEGNKQPALQDISFEIMPGEWVAIIGHNGSGKSTLAKTINGLLLPEEGQVTVAGLTLNEENIWQIRQRVGMVFQNPDNQFVGSTVADDVAFGLENQGIPRPEMVERVEHALDKVRMRSFADKEPARLSGGQKQRVAIAGVVAARPDVIILDEATSMLDPKGRHEVLDIIAQLQSEQSLTVLSITHDIDEAAHADRIFVIQGGHLVQVGTPAEIFSEGPRLIKMGLDLPFPEKLKVALAERGIHVPANYLSAEGMVDWLWTLHSNK